MDPLAKKLVDVMEAISVCFTPVYAMKPSSEDVDTMIKNFTDNQENRISRLLSALDACPEFKFGDHSDYLHFLVTHCTDQCLYTLTKFRRHISEFNCQTSEHDNKVLKRLVEQLSLSPERALQKYLPVKATHMDS